MHTPLSIIVFTCVNICSQGLPPLAKVHSQQETPNRLDRRSVLPPVKGGLISLQASRALATGPGDTFGSTGVAMPDRPARLPPLRGGEGGASLFGPTNMPDRPLHLGPIQRPDNQKGKSPIGGNLLTKKSTVQPIVEEGTTGETKPSVPGVPDVTQPFRMARPLPSIGQKQQLPQIGGLPRALPAISMRTPLPSLTSPTSSMPPRRIAPDPFTTGLNTSSTLTGLTSPARMTPAPLQSVKLPLTRPSLSPTKLPTKVTTVGPLSPVTPGSTATRPTEASPPPPSTESVPPSNGTTGEVLAGDEN